MYIKKELIKKTGYFMENYMYLKQDAEENDIVFFAKMMGEYMRNYGMMDYDTKQQLIDTLKEFIQKNDIVLEDEELFLKEVVKHLPFKVWGD